MPEIPYSEFLERVGRDQVARVVITQDAISGEMKPPGTPAAAPSPAPAPSPLAVPGKETPWRLDFNGWWQRLSASEQAYRQSLATRQQEALAARQRQFTVIPLPDPRLVETLRAHGVQFQGEIESHWASNLLLNWILPFGVMFVIWGALMRRMGPGGRGVLGIGQSKAKISPSTA